MYFRLHVLMVSIFVTVAGAFGAAAQAPGKVVIQEWPVPFEQGRPRDPYVGPDGAIWFVGQKNHYLARFDAKSREFSQRKLGDGAGPHNLIVGRDGIVWYAGNRKGYIGRYDFKNNQIEKIKTPAGVNDPHTLVFDADQRHIWFTAQWSNLVGRMNIKTRRVEVIPVPTDSARPYGVVIAPDSTIWVALLGTNKLASINPATLKLTEHELPDADAGPRRLAVTSNNQVYYVDYSLGQLGHLDPRTGKIRLWPSPSGDGSGPYAMAVDGEDRIWFVETGVAPNRLIGFSPRSGKYISTTEIPSGGGSVRHMVFHAQTNSLWFGTDTGTLARARLN